jgi:hypothetical protein
MPGMFRRTGGQVTLEWLAIVALVGTLLAAGAALAEAGYVGRRITREMARAICIVGGGDCWRDREPCVLTAASDQRSVSVDVVFVHLGGGTTMLEERRSDGTVSITQVDGAELGLEAGIGAQADVRVAGLDVRIQAALIAAETGTLAHGRTWVLPSPAAAERFVEDLGSGRGWPVPDITYREADLAASLRGLAGASLLGADLDAASATWAEDRRVTTRVDHRSGHRTLIARSRWDADLSVAGSVLGTAGGGGETYAVELDAGGRPLDLQVIGSGRFDGSRDLPDVLQPVAGLLDTATTGERRYEVTAHLDLTDPQNAAAAGSLVAALLRRGVHVGPPPALSQALRRHIEERGTIEARVLDQQLDATDVGGRVALGAEVGLGVHREHGSLRLVAAASRGLDGQWLRREDCVPR